jgi:hypothetical protein
MATRRQALSPGVVALRPCEDNATGLPRAADPTLAIAFTNHQSRFTYHRFLLTSYAPLATGMMGGL